jgi:hypothetical protein
MNEVEPLIKDALQRMAPRTQVPPNWADVARRSEAMMRKSASAERFELPRVYRRSRSRRQTMLIAGLMTALIAVASALAAGGIDPFGSISSWINGNPGRPASAREQAGFAARNNASYVAFPSNTKLRLVDETTAGGKAFHLLGFKSGSSLCLRLVQADLPAAIGRNECATLPELRLTSSPALVASETSFIVNDPPQNVDGIFGFADDTVRSIEYRRGHGAWTTVPVKNNVFVALDSKRAAGVRAPRLAPIVQVRAVADTGKEKAVPFISGFADYTSGLPTEPSYLRPESLTAARLPGPANADVAFTNGTIAWLVSRQRRGSAWSSPLRMAELGSYYYGRAIKPNPGSPFAVGLFLVRLTSGTRVPHGKPGELILCEHPLGPFGGAGGVGCHYPSSSQSLFPAGQPFIADQGPGGQLTNITGAAADGVAGLKLFLASGRVIPAALANNAFVVSAPSDQLPGKLVAYDRSGHVLGLQVFGGPEHAVPCPALPPRATSSLPPPANYERLDLRYLTVNGSPILGATPSQVEAALGRPARKAGFIHHGFGSPTFFYGGTLPGAPLLISFSGKPGHYRVRSLSYQGRALTDARLGHILNVQPTTLQNSITTAYPTQFRLVTSYGTNPQQFGLSRGGCAADFANPNDTVTLSFGVQPYQGARPFLTISRP